MIGIFVLQASYRVEERIVPLGKNYETCKINNDYSVLLNFVLFFTNIVTTFPIIGLCFMEWNIEKTFLDVRLVISAIYFDMVLIFIFLIIKFISTDNYIARFLLYESILLIFSISNFFILFGFKIYNHYTRYIEIRREVLSDSDNSNLTSKELKEMVHNLLSEQKKNIVKGIGVKKSAENLDNSITNVTSRSSSVSSIILAGHFSRSRGSSSEVLYQAPSNITSVMLNQSNNQLI